MARQEPLQVQLVVPEGEELDTSTLATDGTVHTAVEVECFNRPGQEEPIQVVRRRGDNA